MEVRFFTVPNPCVSYEIRTAVCPEEVRLLEGIWPEEQRDEIALEEYVSNLLQNYQRLAVRQPRRNPSSPFGVQLSCATCRPRQTPGDAARLTAPWMDLRSVEESVHLHGKIIGEMFLSRKNIERLEKVSLASLGSLTR
jgi:hypothetical protein